MINILFHLTTFIISIKYTLEEEPLQYPEPAGGWYTGDCRSTQIQSPIDIPHLKDSSSLVVDEDSSHAKIESMDYSKVTNAAVNYDGGHKWTTGTLDAGTLNIRLNNTSFKYKLKSIHFHLNSEHRLQNKQYPMEMHMVHGNLNEDDKDNANLVIGVLFDYQNDEENKFLNSMNLATGQSINNANIKDLINETNQFYYYKGGLTTEPCTENVNWIVFRDVRNMSLAQFYKFKEWVEKSNPLYYATGYGNARGPKNLNGRKVYLANYKEVGKYTTRTKKTGQETIKIGLLSKFICFLTLVTIFLA